jgi:hypothetical protein
MWLLSLLLIVACGVIAIGIAAAGMNGDDDARRCETCRFGEDCTADDDEPDEASWYCGHPSHSSPLSAHHEYGGHWTHRAAWCPLWAARDDDRATVVPFQRAHERPALRGRSDAVAVHELRLRQSRLEHHTEVDPWNVNGDDDESDPRRGTQADASAGIYRGHGLSGGS